MGKTLTNEICCIIVTVKLVMKQTLSSNSELTSHFVKNCYIQHKINYAHVYHIVFCSMKNEVPCLIV